jgi:predicted dehydrogenase
MARTWRVGVLGLGHWYSGYGLARALPEFPQAQLVAAAYHDQAKVEEFTDTFGVEAYTDYDDLLARDDIDIVHIAPPVVEIPECTIRAAAAGKHIILGKPMGMTVAQADEMIAAVRRAGVKCVPWQGMRRVNNALKRQIDEGLIGEIKVMHSTRQQGIAEDWSCSGTPGWFGDPAQVPGGAFIDEGIYSLDQFLFLAGSKVTTVEWAKMANLVHKDLQVEDWMMAAFTFENGIVATLESGWTLTVPRLTGPSPKQNALDRLEIVGTEGQIVNDRLYVPGQARLTREHPHWAFYRPMPQYAVAPVPSALAYLIECIEEDKEPEASMEGARNSLAVALAAYEAARSGKPVRLA